MDRLHDGWNRCDICGRFIALDDFADGVATNKLREPDSDLGSEKWDTYHNRCAPSKDSEK
jgi:hypothetical protein